ncbi:MAG: 4Fe-4S dicluster domain-containing protein [Bacillota bacterium]
MARFAMIIDSSRCTGCNACRIACQMQWQLPPDIAYNRLEHIERGTYPQARWEIVPVQCMHCDNPPCRDVCPTGATYKRSDGLVLIDSTKCIGCKYCMAACPYGARQINEDGVPEKCKFCNEAILEGKMPACVSTCMNEVRVFGDTENPQSKISKLIAARYVSQLLPSKGTQPRIYYIKK